MFGAIAKSYFAEKLGVDRKNLVVVSIMPCLAKKYEASRPEFSVEGNPDVDYSIYTRELARNSGKCCSTKLTQPGQQLVINGIFTSLSPFR